MKRLVQSITDSFNNTLVVTVNYEIIEGRLFAETRYTDRPLAVYKTEFVVTPERQKYFDEAGFSIDNIQYAQFCLSQPKGDNINEALQQSIEAGYRLDAHILERLLAGKTAPHFRFRTTAEQDEADEVYAKSRRISQRNMPELAGQLLAIDIFDL